MKKRQSSQKAHSSKKTTKSKRKKTPSKPNNRWPRRLAFVCFVLGIAFALWVVYLDVQVREKFDGRKWKLPAQVFSQPLELYSGQGLSEDDLVYELLALEYKKVARVSRPGEFSQRGRDFEIFSRGFSVADDKESELHFSLTLQDKLIVRFRSMSSSDVSVARLEPIRIGGIYPRLKQDRELTQLHRIPALLGEAIIAVEDRRFVEHHGVSLKDIARAAVVNVKAGKIVQGGSTLTQQLVKNFYLDSGRRFSRKITEAVMSVLLELHYSKAEILETYINEIYLGQSGPRQIHGFALASKHYFQKPLADLNVPDIALLVGLIKGASYYNPWKHPERALTRRDLIIDLLLQQGLISPLESRVAKRAPLGVVPESRRKLSAYPSFIDLVKRQLLQQYSLDQLSSEGLRVYSTLSLRSQRAAEKAVSTKLSQLESQYGMPKDSVQSAAVLVSVGGAEVEAMVGGRNASFAGFNRALNARRSIGSLIKPVVYLAALRDDQSNYHLASMLDDSPVTVQGPGGQLWQPQNFDRKSHGDVQMYDAFLHSYNQATARLGMLLGLDKVVNTLNDLGVEARIPEVPSLLLGSMAMSPMEVAGLYHSLANEGVTVPLRSIRSVVNNNDELLSRYRLSASPKVGAKDVGLIQFAMQGVAREGTGRALYQYLPDHLGVAGKTGTSNDQRDSWFAGFSGDHVGVVWVGQDDNGVTPLTGSSGALKIWGELFSTLSTSGLVLPQFEGVDYLWVDDQTGQLSGKNCQGARLLPFKTGIRPRETANCQWIENPLYHWIKEWF